MQESELFDSLLAQQKAKKYPPIARWHPEKIAESGMSIDTNGDWYYQGSKINRLPMVKLFASILRREGDSYYLVTPPEKLRIEVADAPFQAVNFHCQKQGCKQRLLMTTNLDEHVVVDNAHPLISRTYRQDRVPYLAVRNGLEARLNRSVYYRLAQLAVTGSKRYKERLGIWSSGIFFALE